MVTKKFKCEICGDERKFNMSHSNRKQCINCYWKQQPVYYKEIAPDKKVLFKK